MQKTLEEQVGMLEAELKRKRKIAAAATLAANAVDDAERNKTRKDESTRPVAAAAVGV